MNKEYIPLKSFEGLYLISRQGRIVSLNSNKGGSGINYVKISDRGTVKLIKNGIESHLSLKKLLMRTFNEMPLVSFYNLKGFPSYMINKCGDIFSLRYYRLMKPQPDTKGYLRVRLQGTSSGLTRKIHRLVAETFIKNPLNKPQVNHKNGNKEDNTVENLEWVTNLENMQHAWNNGYFDCHKKGNRNDNY